MHNRCLSNWKSNLNQRTLIQSSVKGFSDKNAAKRWPHAGNEVILGKLIAKHHKQLINTRTCTHLHAIIISHWWNVEIIRSSINWRESKENEMNGKNNLVNDSINGDSLQSIENEEKIIKIHHKDGFILFILLGRRKRFVGNKTHALNILCAQKKKLEVHWWMK